MGFFATNHFIFCFDLWPNLLYLTQQLYYFSVLVICRNKNKSIYEASTIGIHAGSGLCNGFTPLDRASFIFCQSGPSSSAAGSGRPESNECVSNMCTICYYAGTFVPGQG